MGSGKPDAVQVDALLHRLTGAAMTVGILRHHFRQQDCPVIPAQRLTELAAVISDAHNLLAEYCDEELARYRGLAQ